GIGGGQQRGENSFCVMIAPEPRARQTCNVGAAGVPLRLAEAGKHRIRCQHSLSMQRVLRLISWSKNPGQSLIIKGLSPAWLSGRGDTRKCRLFLYLRARQKHVEHLLAFS